MFTLEIYDASKIPQEQRIFAKTFYTRPTRQDVDNLRERAPQGTVIRMFDTSIEPVITGYRVIGIDENGGDINEPIREAVVQTENEMELAEEV